MIKKYKITYRGIKKLHTVVISALSEKDAKRRFVGLFRNRKIVSIEEIKNESKAT